MKLIKFKRVTSLILSTLISLSCFAGIGFTASAALSLPWNIIELESKDKVWISTGLGNETYLKFIPKCTGTYVLESSSIGDAFVTLYDVAENVIATNDNGKDEENFRLAARLTGGVTYYYGVKFTDPRYTGTCLLDHYFTDLECEHENGVHSAGLAVTCHSDGYTPGYWCDDCDCWYVGHDRIEGGHLDSKEDTDDLCDRCGGVMPAQTGEIGPTERPYRVKYQVYPDGSMDIFGTDYIRQAVFADNIYIKNTVKSLKIYDGVKYIDDGVFTDFKLLETVTLPDSITSIRREAFMNCESLKSINIPKNVQYIAEYAFAYCDSLRNVDLPDSMTGGLGFGAFKSCAELLTINLGNGIKTIEEDAFYGCISLGKIEWGYNVTTIKARAFENCRALSDVTIPNSVISIGACAFRGCESITKVTIGDGVTTIGEHAFALCYELENVTMGNNVKFIGKAAFTGCYPLIKVHITDLAAWCGIEFEDAFSNPVTGSLYINGTKVIHLVIPEGVTSIGNYAFIYCSDLQSVTISDGVKSIGEDAFYSCRKIAKLVIPESVTSVGNSAFSFCGNHTVVYYCGTEAQLNEMEIGYGNEVLVTDYISYHDYDNECDQDCNICLKMRQIKHEYSYPCDAYCDLCFDYRNTIHSYTNNCDEYCNVCDEFREITHSYSNDCDIDCNVCGAKREINHSYTTTINKATFSKNGSVVKSCKICGDLASKTAIKRVKSVKLSATKYTYSGKAKKPSVTVKDSAGKALKKGTDYTVSYSKGCKKVGSYKVTVTLKGNYSGSKTLTFKINPKATKISKVTAAKKSLKVKIKKQTTETTGYEVQYSTSKKFTKSTTKTATVKKAKTTSLTLKKLKAKKTYYLRIRTYKTVGGKKFYSAWSKVTSKKTK